MNRRDGVAHDGLGLSCRIVMGALVPLLLKPLQALRNALRNFLVNGRRLRNLGRGNASIFGEQCINIIRRPRLCRLLYRLDITSPRHAEPSSF
jgi:hypothetical protein